MFCSVALRWGGGGGGWRLGFETCLFEFMGDGVGFCSSSLSCCSRALYL